MGKKLFVGNLAFTITNEDLSSAFAQFGTVESASVITDRDTGRSKGFGFIEMSSDAEAATCIQSLNNTELGGRAMSVSEAKPKAPREGGGGNHYSSRGGGGGRNNY